MKMDGNCDILGGSMKCLLVELFKSCPCWLDAAYRTQHCAACLATRVRVLYNAILENDNATLIFF